MNLLHKNHIRFLIILALVLISHSSLLFPAYSENPDSNYIYPFLRDLSSPLDYLSKLASFETFDFQPVRDLTLWMDVWVQDHFGFVISIFFNCLIWAGCCFLILNLLELDLTLLTTVPSFLMVGCFAVYPIFLQIVNWGIARKHLLAFFFTLYATRAFFEWMRTKKGETKIFLLYTLSILSLPISMGWPVWMAGYLYLTDKEKLPQAKKLLMILFVVMFLIVGINWAYYKSSYTFLEVYPRKASGFDPYFMALFVGHLIWQIIFPYNLSLYYSYREGALAGFALLLLASIYLYWKKRDDKFLWAWYLFAAVHVGILMSTPSVYFDSYVLMPSFALLIIIAHLFSVHIEKRKFFLVPFLLFWFGFTLSQNWIWGDSEEFFTRSYRNEQSCSNALALGFARYGKGKKLSNEVYDFIQTNACLSKEEGDSPATGLRKMVFESTMLFHEDEVDLEYREKRLLELGARHFFPLTVYAALLAKLDRSEDLERVMKYLNGKFAGSDSKIARDRMFAVTVPPYCERKELEECRKFVRNWLSE